MIVILMEVTFAFHIIQSIRNALILISNRVYTVLGSTQEQKLEKLNKILKRVKRMSDSDVTMEVIKVALKRVKLSSNKPKDNEVQQSNEGDHHDEEFDNEGFACIKGGLNKNPIAEHTSQITKFIMNDLGVLKIEDKDLEELVDILTQIVAE